jgi:O-antigen/teichoic acid export membrane protein
LLSIVVVWLCPLQFDERVLLTWFALGNIVNCMNWVPLYDARHRQALTGVIAFGAESAALALVLTLVSLERLNLTTVGAVYAAKWMLSTTLQVVLFIACVQRVPISFSRSRVWAMLNSAWPMLLASTASAIPVSGGVVFVRAFYGNADAGILGIGVQVLSGYLMLTLLFSRVLYPHISGPYGFQHTFIAKLSVAYGAFLALAWLATILASWAAIHYYLAAEYRRAFGPAAILSMAGVVLSIRRIFAMYLVAKSAEKGVLACDISAAAIFILCCFIFVPMASYYGAIGSTIASSLIVSGGMLLLLRSSGSAS